MTSSNFFIFIKDFINEKLKTCNSYQLYNTFLKNYDDKSNLLIGATNSDNNDYASLEQLIASNVRSIIAIGEDKEKIFDMYCSKIRCVKANSLEDAVTIASKEAKSGDTILFSPACKSFDMFANYEHRGLVFKQAVMSL